jgi:hypothetical protein
MPASNRRSGRTGRALSFATSGRVDKGGGTPYYWGVVLSGDVATMSNAHGTKAHRIDVGGVLHTGRELSVREAVPLSEFATFRFPSPIDAALRLRRAGHGLDVTGTLDGESVGECARCLDDVRLPLHVEVGERFEPEGDDGNPLGESNVLSGEQLDLQDLVRQLIDSALPIVLLCTEDCQGLCADCGNKRDGDCRCTTPE